MSEAKYDRLEVKIAGEPNDKLFRFMRNQPPSQPKDIQRIIDNIHRTKNFADRIETIATVAKKQ